MRRVPRTGFASAHGCDRTTVVLYRMRIYQAVRENLPIFHEFFRTHLLPVQLRHGARLVGRWETQDGRVVAIWEYDDVAAYEQIQGAVRADPDSRRAQDHRAQMPGLITITEEVFMSSTINDACRPDVNP
jgi:hypothetical protein